MKVLVAGMLDLSSVDYPRRPAAVIFVPGCNYRCPICQNWQILEAKPEHQKDIEEVFRFVDKASLTIEAIKVTGGEPTLYPELLQEARNHAHKKGLLFGFDTNGFLHGVVKELLTNSDLISLDLKTSPTNPDLLEKLIGLPGKGREAAQNMTRSLEMLMQREEVYADLRTTVVPGVNDSPAEFERIGDILSSLGYDGRASRNTASYTLQEFVPEHANSPSMRAIRSPTPRSLLTLANATRLRNVYIKHRDIGFMVHRKELPRFMKNVAEDQNT